MKTQIKHHNPAAEFSTEERCHIIELYNSENDPELSIARARVTPGVTTQWHSLKDTAERYVILEGEGQVEIGDLPPTRVNPGGTVTIPPGCRQRITNTGKQDLIFLALCTPRFRQENYQNLEKSGNRFSRSGALIL